MSKPTQGDAKAIAKAIARLCRFLKGLPRLVQRIPFADHPPSIIEVYVDSDWAGCRRSRKSTSGGVIMFGGSAVKGWSSNQRVIALSSGEAEYYAALKGASSALCFRLCLLTLASSRKLFFIRIVRRLGVLSTVRDPQAPPPRNWIPLVASGRKSKEAAGPEGSWDREPGRPLYKAPHCSRYVEALGDAPDINRGR